MRSTPRLPFQPQNPQTLYKGGQKVKSLPLLHPFPRTLRGASDLSPAFDVLPKEESIRSNHVPPLVITQRQAEDILQGGLDFLQSPRSLGYQKVFHGRPVSRRAMRCQDLDDPLMLIHRVFATCKDAMNLLGHHFDRCAVNHARTPFSFRFCVPSTACMYVLSTALMRDW